MKSFQLLLLCAIFCSIQVNNVDAVDCIIKEGNTTRGHVRCDSGCCEVGCCVHFYIYQIWYFWLCVLFAISLCSVTGRYYYRQKYVHQRIIVRPVNDQNIANVDTTNEYATAGSGSGCVDSHSSDNHDNKMRVGNSRRPMSIISPPSYAECPPSYDSLFIQTQFDQEPDANPSDQAQKISAGNQNVVIVNHERVGQPNDRAGHYVCSTTYNHFITSDVLP